MSGGDPKGPLDDGARKRAIDMMRGAASRPRARMAGRFFGRKRQKAFDELAEFRQLDTIREVGEALGIANPFFRSHDGAATAVSHIDGRECANFASYDYLGLGQDARVRAAAHAAIDQYGISAGASRLVAGERPVHRQLEMALARHYGCADAIVFVSGHATNVATIGELMGEKDLILTDSLIHNSIQVGAQLSGASRRSFPHNDMEALARLLQDNRGAYQNALVAVEGLYSMDGDLPDLPRLLELREQFGFWLMVDEAHALGAVGATGFGLAEHYGIDPGVVDIWMGTLSKTLGSTGGYIAGSAALVEILKTQAPGFVYSVGLPPVLAATAAAALEVLESEPERTAKLQENGAYFLRAARAAGLDTGESLGLSVVPVLIGDSLRAGKVSERLLERGVNVLPIVFPAVPMNAARLRFFITAQHSTAQIDLAVRATREEIDRLEQENFGKRLPPKLALLLRSQE